MAKRKEEKLGILSRIFLWREERGGEKNKMLVTRTKCDWLFS